MVNNTGKENKSKIVFLIAVGLCFITILIYECITPVLMDDMSYMGSVREASSLFELFGQERQQYLGWTGRSVAHMMLRILMYTDLNLFGGGRLVFNVAAAIFFTGLTLLIYVNIQNRKKYDVMTYLLIVLLIWVFGVSFAETVLWETGACNYLFTTTIILSFMTLFRKKTEEATIKEDGGINYSETAGIFILGILAGWCNENTSGGCLLFVIMLTAFFMKGERKIRPWMVAGILGNIIGLAFMVFAPGNAQRAQNREELHSGLLGMAARFLNMTNAVYEEFFILLSVLIVLVVFLVLSGKKVMEMLDIYIFAGLSLITVYALILTVTPQNRAMFGAGIFLIIAVVQAYREAVETELFARTICQSAVIILCLYMFFTYLSAGASLARIYREEQERYDYLEQVAETGAEDAAAPMLRPQFDNKYTVAYDSDITDDWTYWTNVMMAQYYGFKTLLGVDRDEWTEY